MSPDTEALTQEELEAKAESDRQARIEAFALNLKAKRTAAIQARASSGVERRWLADMDAYHGRDSTSKANELLGLSPTPKKQTQRRSSQYVQKTRSKTNSASAHLGDILFPSDDKNWRLQPTPVPELMQMLKNTANETFVDPKTQAPVPHPEQQGQMLTNGDVATDLMKAAREKCARMETEIDDQLVECQYNAEGRKVIDDAAQLGTGIMRGPIAVTRTKKRWVKTQGPDGKSFFQAEVTVDQRPSSNRVDPWNAYPAPGCGEDIHSGAYFFEKELMSPSALKELAKVDGFQADQILACIKEPPIRAREADDTAKKTSGEGEYLDTDALDVTNYEVWSYWGEVDREDMQALGIELTDETEMQTVSAAVVMCNDRVIRAMLNPSDMGEIPYDFFIWERMTGSPWGVGIPYLMRYAQKAMNAAWRQMQDNAGVSHGPQIVMNRKAVQPADGQWDIYGNKLWFATEDAIDVKNVFTVHHIENRQEPLAAIFQIANQLADDETVMPQLMQGDQNDAPDKVGVARIIANSASVMLKRYARNWDDRITSPHLRRYYDWNMQYSENEEAKGDYCVQALGSTHLVVKDQRMQDIANTVAMASNPLFQPFINAKRLAQAQVQATAIKEAINTEEELAENAKLAEQNPPPADPKVEAQKLKTQGDLEIQKMRVEGEIAAEQVEAQSEIKNQELRMIEAARNDERELAKMQLQVDLEVLKMANAQQISVQEIKAQLAMKVMDVNAKSQQQAVQGAQKQSELREQGNQKLTERAQEQMGKFEEEKV